jgi:5-methylcytosine-specific restriction enzyme A
MNNFDKALIIFRIGWMKHYQGMKGDTIRSGANFVAINKFGYEMYNFLPYDGYVYGFVQPTGTGDFTQRTIRIERLGAHRSSDSVNNVLVAWVAPHISGGVYLVGWYRNATVYRNYQEMPNGSGRNFQHIKVGYFARARESDSVLLPEDGRTLPVPKASGEFGGLGQSLVWYADTRKRNDVFFRQNLFDFIESHEHNKFENTINDYGYSDQKYSEGTPRRMSSTSYERNRKAREICIKFHGYKCQVCNFDFLDFYGEVGEGYIHVHHIKSLSEVGQVHKIDPIQDLIPVCPNCHAMIHKRRPPYSLSELKAFIRKGGG